MQACKASPATDLVHPSRLVSSLVLKIRKNAWKRKLEALDVRNAAKGRQGGRGSERPRASARRGRGTEPRRARRISTPVSLDTLEQIRTRSDASHLE